MQTPTQKRDWKRQNRLRTMRQQGLEPDGDNDSEMTCIVCHKTTKRLSTNIKHRHYEGCPYG